MENKFITFFLVIPASFVVFIMILIEIGYFKGESFTIYKIECENKTEYLDYHMSSDRFNLIINKSELVFLNRELLMSRAKETNDTVTYSIILNLRGEKLGDVCEQKEVNETIINYEIQITCEISAKYCDNYIPYPVVITANGSNIEDISMEGCKGNCRKEVISTAVQVKNLTRKWLDENFECICPEGYGQLVEDYGNGTRKTLGTCNFVDIEKHKNDMILCSKWKMGDYTVVKQ